MQRLIVDVGAQLQRGEARITGEEGEDEERACAGLLVCTAPAGGVVGREEEGSSSLRGRKGAEIPGRTIVHFSAWPCNPRGSDLQEDGMEGGRVRKWV